MRWVIALLIVFALWTTFILYVSQPLPDSKFFGGFFLLIGIANVLFCKTTGRKLFAKTQASPHFIARVWAHGGEKGVQVLFLGIGIILVIAGCAAIIVGSA